MAAETVNPYSTGVLDEETPLDWYFPKADPLHRPLGQRVLVQVRRVKEKSKGGIILATDTKDTEMWNTQVARVIELGPLAFRNRESLQPWSEGLWAKPGDFVRIPRWAGDRWSVEVGKDEPHALFVMVNDHEIIAQITGDPRKVRAFIQ